MRVWGGSVCAPVGGESTAAGGKLQQQQQRVKERQQSVRGKENEKEEEEEEKRERRDQISGEGDFKKTFACQINNNKTQSRANK